MKSTLRLQQNLIRPALNSVAVSAWIVPSVTLADGEQKVEPVAVIVHGKLSVDKLSLNDLRKYWLAERQSWGGDNHVVLLMPAGGRARELVLKKIYQMTEGQYKQFWIAKVFRSEAQSDPRTVSNARSAIDQVSRTVGAISCIDADDVPKSVKLLPIDGRQPGEKGYALQ